MYYTEIMSHPKNGLPKEYRRSRRLGRSTAARRPETGKLRDPGSEEGAHSRHCRASGHQRAPRIQALGQVPEDGQGTRAAQSRKARKWAGATMVRAVLAEHDWSRAGALTAARYVRAKCHTSYYDAYRIMRKAGTFISKICIF